jgi:hypothetical protein
MTWQETVCEIGVWPAATVDNRDSYTLAGCN